MVQPGAFWHHGWHRKGIAMLAIAHRGASAYAPENTRSAFALAIAMRADMIETDIQLTSDGHLVLVHDTRVDRTTSGTGPVASLTLGELRELDAGAWFDPRFTGERIMTLAEFETEFGDRIPACLEIKDPSATDAAIAHIRAASAFANAQVTSFNWDSAVTAAAALTNPVGYLTRQVDSQLLSRCVDHGLKQVCPHVSALTPQLVTEAKALGLTVRAWGITTRADIDHLFATGADGATSNWPDWITGHPNYRTETAS
jgi:glycerophosphoryl diester phosphodiesterase